MTLKFFKVLTVLSFLLITFDSGHFGGAFGTYLFLGLLFDDSNIISALLILLVLIIFLISAIKKIKKIDLYIFIIGGIILMIPIIIHFQFILTAMTNRGDIFFYLTLVPFLFFYGATIYMLIRKKSTMRFK